MAVHLEQSAMVVPTVQLWLKEEDQREIRSRSLDKLKEADRSCSHMQETRRETPAHKTSEVHLHQPNSWQAYVLSRRVLQVALLSAF